MARRSCSVSALTELRAGRDLTNNSLLFGSGVLGTGAVDPGRLLHLRECFVFSDNPGVVLFPNPGLILQGAGQTSLPCH